MHARVPITDDGLQESRHFRAGERAPAGVYCEIDGRREVILPEPDTLPATCDGHVAIYVRRPLLWEDIHRRGATP